MAASYDFIGKKILVTGGSRGIGRGIVEALIQSGANVYALGQNESNLAELKEKNPLVETICVDIADVKAAKTALAPLHPLDGLVNNAAVAIPDDFLDLSTEHFDKLMSVNVRGNLFLGQAVAAGMVAGKVTGSVVNVSSAAAQGSLKGHTAYSMAKASLDALSRSMALELGPLGIRVNSVNPTVVMTDMGRMAWSDPAKSGPMLKRIPMCRFAEVSDVVGAVLWLLSDASLMTTGAALPVEGGYWAN